MIVKKSILQLFRTPVKVCLFFLLLTAAVVIFTLGSILNVMTSENLKRFEESFMTIGIVDQTPVGSIQISEWDAELEEYSLANRFQYGETVPLSALDFEDAEYLSGPEKRTLYLSSDESYELYNKDMPNGHGPLRIVIVEVQPEEDCVPNGPVKMNLVRTLFSDYEMNMPWFYFCDHFNDDPQMMYADKTYVMCIESGVRHGWRIDGEEYGPDEYVPSIGLFAEQYDVNGGKIENMISERYYEEVTDEFYETESGKQWLEFAKGLSMYADGIKVMETENINLIVPFYEGNAYITDGRGFSEEEYAEGRKVCLVSRFFANNNNLSVGDVLHLSLVTAYPGVYSNRYLLNYSLLNAKGEVYLPFEEDEYEIVGVYTYLPGTSRTSSYSLDENQVILPTGSVTGDYSDNIPYVNRMVGSATAFQIPNGNIDEYMELWEQQSIENVEIQFYDKGFTQIKEGLDNIKRISVILLAVGVATSVLILVFFCHLFITKQNRRTAIERSLGLSKRKCMVSMLTGLLLLVAAGSATGSAVGSALTQHIVAGISTEEQFERKYSSSALVDDTKNKIAYSVSDGGESSEIGQTSVLIEDERFDTTVNRAVPPLGALAVFVTALVISYFMMRKNLASEPLELLSTKET